MITFKKYTLIFFVLASNVLSAGERQIDSLKTRLSSAEGNERVKIQISLMRELQRSASQEAIDYGNEALMLLKKFADNNLKVEVLYYKGWAYLHMNELDSAKAYARITGKAARDAGMSRGVIWEYFLTARILRTEGLYEEAIKIINAALEEIEKDYDAVLKAKLLNELGSVNRRLSNYNEALDYHKQALNLLIGLNNVDELPQTYTYLGISNDIIGNYAEALRFHQLALQLNKKESDTRGIAGSNHNIGILYQKLGQYDKALEYYNQAINYWNELGEKNNLASTLNSIGAINELKQNPTEALLYYKQALAIWEKIGIKYSLAIALNNIGSIYLSLGNYPESLKHLNRSIQIRKDIGDKGGTASSLLRLADVYNQLGDIDSAIAAGREALKLAKESGGWSAIREAHIVLSDIFERNGRYKEALAEYKNYKAAHDSMFNSESQEKIAELEAKYKTEEQNQQIELLKRDSEIKIFTGQYLLPDLFWQ